MSVFSRPAIGTRQYGVDVGAVGGAEGRVQGLPHFDQTGGSQTFRLECRPTVPCGRRSMRYRDVYIPKLLPGALQGSSRGHRSLPRWRAARRRANERRELHRQPHVRRAWNSRSGMGIMLAQRLLSGVLRENALPETWRSDFRKSLALVDEPDASFEHFRCLVNSIGDACEAARTGAPHGDPPDLPRSLDASMSGGRNAKKHRSRLSVWRASRPYCVGAYQGESQVRIGRSAANRTVDWDALIELHFLIADDYINSYVEPRAKTAYGLSAAVPSHASLDVNLRLFDLVGRIGSRGLWLLHSADHLGQDGQGGRRGRSSTCRAAYSRASRRHHREQPPSCSRRSRTARRST